MNQLKLAILTDIHAGIDKPTRPGSQAYDLMQQFVKEMNNRFHPDVVVDLGDRLHDTDIESDRVTAKRLADLFNQLDSPHYHVLGNHDLTNLLDTDNKELFGCETGAVEVTIGEFGLVFLNSQDPTIDDVGGSISEKQLGDLKAILGDSENPTLVFSHHAFDEQEMADNPLFTPFPDLACASNRSQIRQLLSQHDNMIAAFAGHVHWFHCSLMDLVPYVSVPSFTEAWHPGVPAPGTYCEAVISSNHSISLTVRSLKPDQVLAKLKW